MSAPSSLPLLFVSPFPSTSFVRIYLFRTHRTQNTSCLPYAKILLYLCPKWICFIMAYTRIITIFLQRFKASSLLCQGVPLTDFFLLSWWTPHRSSFCAVSSIVQKWCHRLVPAHVGGFIQATFISSNYLHLSAEQSLSFSSFSHCCW